MARGDRNMGWPGFFRVFTVLCAMMLLLAQSGQQQVAAGSGAWQVLSVYEGLTCWAVPALFMLWGMLALEEGRPQVSASLLGADFWIGQGNGTLKALFGALEALGEKKDFLAREKQVHIAELIVTELAGIYSQGEAVAEQDTPEDRKLVIIEEAFLYEYDSLTLKGLALRLGMSTRQTQRVLARYYGMAFREKKTAARLEAAYVMIQNGNSVGGAASSVGYSDAASFIRAFKKQYGITPSKIGKG